MCKFGTGKKGDQGATGPTGAAGSLITNFMQANTSIAASTDVTVTASATKTGQLVWNGVFAMESATTSVQVTITPVIGGVVQTALAVISSLSSFTVGGLCKGAIPVLGVANITLGQAIAFRIDLHNYTFSGKAILVSVNYTIQ